ncbi:MAG: hypothetical protein JNK82_28960 [Myxococcaceae bacterium]|nr:hypothetical protein [Myxococcaceae bacterium]
MDISKWFAPASQLVKPGGAAQVSGPVQATPAPAAPAASPNESMFEDSFEPLNKMEKEMKPSAVALATHSVLKAVDALMAQGRYAEARAFAEGLKNSPFAGEPFNAWQKFENTSAHTEQGSNKVTKFKHPADLTETVGALAQRKLDQINQTERMSNVLGRTVDPTNINEVKAYFDTISAKNPPAPLKPMTTAQVQQEFGAYTKNFYSATGGLDWDPKDKAAARVTPGTLNEMFHGDPPHPRDLTGRAATDCEGLTYLTAAVFQNNPRFDVSFAGAADHISATVFEKGTADQGFSVNLQHEPWVNPLQVSKEELAAGGKTIEDKQNHVSAGRFGNKRKSNGTYSGNPEVTGRDITKVNYKAQ